MYKPIEGVLYTNTDIGGGGQSQFVPLHSNGTYVRLDNGTIVGRVGKQDEGIPIILHSQFVDERIHVWITDSLLRDRIRIYWTEHFGQEDTNCAAFAQFLLTGNFVKCNGRGKNNMVFQHGMQPFAQANRIDVGDVCCLLYGHEQIASRKFASHCIETANKFQRAKKARSDKRDFRGCVRPTDKRYSWTAQQIRELADEAINVDFHFMVCVAKKGGQPIWLSQCGYHEQGTQPVPFAVTPRLHDPYLESTPLFSFIKKRR